jgi:hypothetical protein
MNQLQQEIVEVFEFPKKYDMYEKDEILLKNAVQMLVHALNVLQNNDLINELQKLMNT